MCPRYSRRKELELRRCQKFKKRLLLFCEAVCENALILYICFLRSFSPARFVNMEGGCLFLPRRPLFSTPDFSGVDANFSWGSKGGGRGARPRYFLRDSWRYITKGCNFRKRREFSPQLASRERRRTSCLLTADPAPLRFAGCKDKKGRQIGCIRQSEFSRKPLTQREKMRHA